MDDESLLVKHAQNGDSSSFGRLYLRFVKIVYGFVYQKTDNREDCEDLTQEIWMNVIKNLKDFEGKSSFKNWIFGITKHKLMDYYREKYKIDRIPLVEEVFDLTCHAELVSASEEIPKQVRDDKITKMLSKLPNHYRQVLTLRFLKGYKTAEIAKELRMTVNNVKVMQFRAIQKLRHE